MQFVKCIVLLLHAIVQAHDEPQPTPPAAEEGGRHSEAGAEGGCWNSRVLLLRKGVSLLHCLSALDPPYSRHYHQVEHQYVETMYAIERLFQDEHDGATEHDRELTHTHVRLRSTTSF